ncbi:MAG: YfbM family protein [Cytophagales bacterium]|nr:YfbM family protein [Cytophaga sp.]
MVKYNMGMIGHYLRVSKEELGIYLEDSSILEDRLFGEHEETDVNLLDIEKAWEGLFYLLTGKSLNNCEEAKPPLCWILNAANEIDVDQDLGYGPASYTTIEQTKEICDAMNSISVEELQQRYDGVVMMGLGIYPEIWDEAEAVDYLIENFLLLKLFYNKASDDQQAMISFIL